jgi:hypothetical protein
MGCGKSIFGARSGLVLILKGNKNSPYGLLDGYRKPGCMLLISQCINTLFTLRR